MPPHDDENHSDDEPNNSNNSNNANISNTQQDLSNNTILRDLSNNIDIDCMDISLNPIVNYTLNETIDGDGYIIQNQQGTDISNNEITHTTFITKDLSNIDFRINQNLAETFEESYYDISNSLNVDLVNQIKNYAQELKCQDFHGKGTIDDYSQLFLAASKIANESKQMNLDIDIEGFNEFSQAADEMSKLFDTFIVKLQNVNIINDTSFLQAILNALEKIVNLSNVFGKFKEIILATSTIQLPKSIHDTSVVLHGVMDEINCAMNYIGHFVSPTMNLPQAELSDTEKNIISKAVDTIDNWNILCDQGVSIALSNNEDLNFIKQSSNTLKTTTQTLKSNTLLLKNKLASYNITKQC
jgi:hypothetical protein